MATYRDFGITWDELPSKQYGDYLLSFYGALARGERPPVTEGPSLDHPADDPSQTPLPSPGLLGPWAHYPYVGGFDLLGAVARRGLPLPEHDTLHLVGALVGILTAAGGWGLGRLLFGAAGGFLSALFLVCTPVFYGSMFNNPKDPPFAAGYVWALFAICALLQRVPEVRFRLWIGLAAGLAAAMCVRVVGAVCILYALGGVAVLCAWQGSIERDRKSALVMFRAVGARVALAGACAWSVMLLLYPAGLSHPLTGPLASARQLGYLRSFVSLAQFGGRPMFSYDVPRSYLPTYFLLQLPEAVLILLVVVAVQATFGAMRPPRDAVEARRWTAAAVLAAAILVPPTLAIAARSALYDGLRHFLFLVPPLCVAAAGGAVALVRRLSTARPALGWLYAAALALSLGTQVVTMKRLHPHQYVYFNWLAGGLPGGAAAYETDYYGNSHREAFAGLQRELWRSEPATYLDRVYVVDGCLGRYPARHYLPPSFRLADLGGESADFFLADRRLFCAPFWNAGATRLPAVSRVERFGTTLSVFLDQRPSAGAGG